MSEADDIAACRALLKGGSRSFHAASLALPRGMRDRATALYAFCRLADDAVDAGDDGAAALVGLHHRLDRIYRGESMPQPADRAFAAVVQHCAIPRTLPEALLEGFAWDVAQRRYDTLDDLLDYAARVAGAVGAMMALVMGRRAPHMLARACDLGIAMQLTNIARDVGEDARAGRLYLPQQWLREAGVDPDAWLAAPRFSPQLALPVQRLLDVADMLYRRAATGIAELPLTCRPGMHAARILYAEIGRALQRAGLDSVSQRAVVSPRRKLLVLMSGVFAPAINDERAAPPLQAAHFLVEAVAPLPAPPPRTVEDRLIWVLDLFTRLEQRDAMMRVRP